MVNVPIVTMHEMQLKFFKIQTVETSTKLSESKTFAQNVERMYG